MGTSVGLAACTVTTSSDGDAGDLFADSGNGGGDSGGSTDSGGQQDTGTTCTSRDETFADGGVLNRPFGDNPGQPAGACDTCLDNNCCSQIGSCFQDPTFQCQDLDQCIQACQDQDGGDPDGGCSQTCADAFTNTQIDQYNAGIDCLNTNCATECVH